MQTEIDTHLNVLHIALNRKYDHFTETHPLDDVLGHMRNLYAKDSWHFTSPSGVNPDLHHLLLGNRRVDGGGKAYQEKLCYSNWGFSFSNGLTGSYQSMSEETVYDMWIVSHYDVDLRICCDLSHPTNLFT
jgi:hypothetical protein